MRGNEVDTLNAGKSAVKLGIEIVDVTEEVVLHLLHFLTESGDLLVGVSHGIFEGLGGGIVDVTLEVTLGESELGDDVVHLLGVLLSELLERLDLLFGIFHSLLEFRDVSLVLGQASLEISLELLQLGLRGGDLLELLEVLGEHIVVELGDDLGHLLVELGLVELGVGKVLDRGVDQGDGLGGGLLVLVELGLVELAGLEVGDLLVDGRDGLVVDLVDLSLEGILGRVDLVGEILDVLRVVRGGLEGSDGSLETGNLVLERGNLARNQIVNLLVYLLDVDLVVGGASEQGGSGEEQHCKFGEFDFHKSWYRIKD